jgi:hypothetical protein
MKRALALALSFALPLFVGGTVLSVMMAGGNEDLEGWLRAAWFTVIPAAFANVVAAWIVALRPGASAPARNFGALLRAFATFALAVPLLWLFAAAAVWLAGEKFGSGVVAGGVVAIFAAPVGVLPMTVLQWLAYHVTLERRTA